MLYINIKITYSIKKGQTNEMLKMRKRGWEMTGKEIFKMMLKADLEYLQADEDDLPRPIIYLTIHQLCKLKGCVGVVSLYWTQISALIEGAVSQFTYDSVIIKRKVQK